MLETIFAHLPPGKTAVDERVGPRGAWISHEAPSTAEEVPSFSHVRRLSQTTILKEKGVSRSRSSSLLVGLPGIVFQTLTSSPSCAPHTNFRLGNSQREGLFLYLWCCDCAALYRSSIVVYTPSDDLQP